MRTKTLEQNTAQDFAGLQIDQLSKLRNGSITFEQVKWFNNLSFEQREALMGSQHESALFWRLISRSETLILDALDGKETLMRAKEVFPAGIDRDFKKMSTNKAGIATQKQAVYAYELVRPGTLKKMFNSFGVDLDKLCLTQAQIKNFCRNHPWLDDDGHETLFLFKVEDQFFFAHVYVSVYESRVGFFKYKSYSGLCVKMLPFSIGNCWHASRSLRLVVPQLTA